jgi:hypothetical protein
MESSVAKNNNKLGLCNGNMKYMALGNFLVGAGGGQKEARDGAFLSFCRSRHVEWYSHFLVPPHNTFKKSLLHSWK